MITITKNGNAVLFEFEENSHYLYNGTIEVPLNSLSLVTDESEMFTFKKAATNDIFISARYDDVNMSKSQLIDFYIANMVGGTGGSESGITSGDVESMIEASLEDYYDIDEVDAALSGKADTSAVTESINAAVSGKQDTLIAGSGITISGNVISAQGGNNVIELTQAEYYALVTGGTVDHNAFYIITDATEINISDYYTRAQTQSAINAAVSGKADTSSVYTKGEVDTALSGKQDVSGMTAYTTSSDVESYVSGFTYDKATIDSKVASGGTFDPTNYYDKTATDALLDDKFDASAFTSYSAATDARLAEDEEVTAAALNALNDELSAKQDTLVAGDNITISGNVISAIGGGGSITVDPSLDSGSTNAVANSAITAALNDKCNKSVALSTYTFGSLDNKDFIRFQKANGDKDSARYIDSINGHVVWGTTNINAVKQWELIEISAITTSITSASTDSQVPSAKAVYDALQESGGGGVSESAFTSYSASTDARMSEDEEVTAAALNALNDRVDAIDITVDDALDATSENPVQNKVIYAVIGDIESLLSNI